MKRIILLLMVLVCALTCGCNSIQTFKNEDDVLKIGFIYETMTVERWRRDRDIFVSEAEKLGAVVYVKNAYEDSKRQYELGVEMIEEGMDVLVIVAFDKDDLSDLVKYAHNKNVKVIAYDRLIRNADVDLYISFDNYRVGYLMGQTATRTVTKGDYLIVNGTQRDNNSEQINDGYYTTLQPFINKGDIKIIGETWIDKWRDEGSYKYVSEVLASGSIPDVIIAANDQLAEGAINALSENRLAGKVFVTGQDAELAACQRIVEGTQSMTVYKPIRILAEGAAQFAVKLAKGEDIGPSDRISDGIYDVKCVIFEPIPVTKDNIFETIIKDGFYTVEQVYANVPQSAWPKASGS
jgi:D-xylose transport system substrate-binding protein